MAQSPTILGKYELLEVIGDGAEGRVYKAVCIAEGVPGVGPGEHVALKRLKNTGHEKESQQFRRQIEILSKLNHPNIVRYKDSFVWREKELEEDIHCLVMELLEGEPLKSLVEKNRGLHWKQAGGVLAQTLQALQYASQNGVVHRDLKPSNIYITRQGVPKLVDFGIARQDDGESTATSSAAGAKGTFDYMAPDFALQHGGFRGDEQSDIFSFGVILYYTLAGSLPFPPLGEHADRGYYIRWLGQKPPVAEYRSPVFRVLSHARSCIAKCIEADRNLRFKTFAELIADFTQIGYRKLRHGAEVYEFTDWLGKGGFGEVFRARRTSDGREVAIKRLFSTGHSSRFVREAKILRAAAHPNLTEYVDFVEVRTREDEREYYLVLEYLDGMPGAGLRDRIKNSASGLDPVEALQLFIRYLDCLEHLHKNGVIHRDIKPGNLYAPEQHFERAKIFDLGIAHDEEGTRTHGQVPGTLDFMPPEFATQESGRGSAQSDIYSIGVTLYQALTKKLPFPRLPEKESEAWVAFFKRSVTPMECGFDHPVFQTHPELVPLLRRALAHDPKSRFKTAGEMGAEITKILRTISAPVFDYDDEQPTAATVIINKPAPKPMAPAKPAVDDEAATIAARPDALKRIERELAQADPEQARLLAERSAKEKAEREAAAAEAAEKRRIEAERRAQERARLAAEEAERVAKENERRAIEEAQRREREAAERQAAAEAAERQRIEDERLALIRAERAAQRRKTMAKVAKVGGIFAAIIALAVGGYFGWNKLQVQLRENAFKKAVSLASDNFKGGDFTAAIAKANEALAIHKDNAAMQELIRKCDEQITLHKGYQELMTNAQDAQARGDYTSVVKFAGGALQKMPGDLNATKLQDGAQMKLNDYHSAVARANAARDKGDYKTSLAETEKALAVYPKDTAMLQLKAAAQSAIASQSAYLEAMTKARAAFDAREFANAITFAGTALQKIPNDKAAERLRDSSQKYLNDFSAASSAATAAFKANDYETADASADKALGIFPKDAAMLKLKTDAQAQMKLRAAYTTAYKNAQAASNGGDYTNAVAWAGEALKHIPGDARAAQVRDDAQKKLDAYHAAVAAANSAGQQGKYDTVVAEADKALAVYPKDTPMQQLKANAQNAIANLQAYRDAMGKAQAAYNSHEYADALTWATGALQKIPGDAAAVKIKNSSQQFLNDFNSLSGQALAAYEKADLGGALALTDKALAIFPKDAKLLKLKADVLRRLDATLVIMLQQFNISVTTELKYAVDKKYDRLGAIGGDTEKKPYYDQVDWLEKVYRLGNWLGTANRQAIIYDLRKRIENWD